MFTQASLRKKVKDASGVLPRCSRGGGSVTFKFWSLPLRVGILRCKQCGLASVPAPCCFFKIRVGKSIVYDIISHDSIETKQKCT